MFKIFLIAFSGLFLLTCNKNTTTDPNLADNGILYKWEWIKSEKFWPQYILWTPDSVGFTRQLSFINDNQVEIYHADTLHHICNYFTEERSITICSFGYTFRIIPDTLILSAVHVDGAIEYYKKL